MRDNRILEAAEESINKRQALVESTWSDYCEELKPWDAQVLATLLQNEAKHLASLDEATFTQAIGTFEKFIFPMIRAVWPNLISQELVSVQPMEGPSSMVFYLDFIAGNNKGSVKQGDTLISSRSGMREEATFYQSETVDAETVLLAGGTLAYKPVRPGSLRLTYTNTAVNYVARDNGNGVITGTSLTGTINYVTGVYTLTSAGSTNLVLSYDYNSEGPNFASNSIPQLDVALTSAPVYSHPDKLRILWSAEVTAALKSVFGLDAEMELTEAIAQQIRFGIDNRIINELYASASAGSVTFDAAPPTGVPYFTHQMALLKTIASGSNQIFKQTRRGQGNWIVAGVDAATIFESHPLFVSSGNSGGSGVVFSGVFANKWKLYKNPFLNNVNGSAFGSKNFLMGFKGSEFYNTGYIYAPWIPFYQTPTIQLDDMMFRKAVMTHYATKLVNGNFYLTGLIDHA